MRTANRTTSRTRNRLVITAAAAFLALVLSGCRDTAAIDGGDTPSGAAPTASAADSGAAGEPSTYPSGKPTAVKPSSQGTPSGASSKPPKHFIKLTEGYPMPNDVLISVTDVVAAGSSSGVVAPAGSQRRYVLIQITNEGTRPLKVDGRVHVTVKRHDNGKSMKQVDWLPGEDSEGAGFFILDVEPGNRDDASLGFAFEDSGFDEGYEIYVTLDQPGSPAYPAKFLYAPPPAS
ncbi:hypothetical protein ACFYT4_36220 [Streptomyces sp. NPDC004609]|uniref:hypothetical protein n=1 Tax=Streptomyces sp. NPDC004609 TaxID=3364704 RepID=UPI0036BF3F98